MQGCLSTVGNERGVTRDFGIRASSQLDGTHTPSYSRLYGVMSWCSKLSGPLPHYLEFDLRSIITVTGLATQGDAVNDKWVTSYTISYGYDRQIWIRYAAVQQLTGNSDKSTVVVNWLSKPFAAQYIRIFPTSYNSGICMRMDLFGCKDFQVPYIFVNKLKDFQLTANPGASVTLKCTARFSPQRPPAYEWSKGATVLPGSNSSLTITYKSATDTHTNYNCVRMDPSAREVNCSSTYQCTASLPGMKDTSGTKANVIVFLKVPGQPSVRVDPGNIKARSTSVTWSYSRGLDELSISEYTLQYQNRSFNDNITLPGGLSSKDLINLKPYTSYSVRMMAKSALGEGLWSGLVNFKTKTAAPSIAPPNITSKKINETTYLISWDPLPREMSNGKVIAYEVKQTMVSSLCTARAISSSAIVLVNTTYSFTVLSGLKACSQYNVHVRAYTTAGTGVFGIPKRILTTVPLAPDSLSASSPQSTSLTLYWKKPSVNSELVEKYQILFNGTKSYFKGFKDSRVVDTSGPVLTYKVDTLLPGTVYTFSVRAKSSCGVGDVGNSVVVETMVDYPRSPNVSVVEKISTPNTSMSVTIWGVEPYNGPISYYQVIVQRVNNWADEIPEKNLKNLLDYDESQEQKQGFYIAAELQSELIHPSLTFDIGDEKRYGTYKNVALAKSQKYKIYIRAVTTAPKYLPGRETVTAMVTIMEDEQGTTKAEKYTCNKPSNTVLVMSNIILGVAFALSLGVNVYFWRVRRIPKTGEKLKKTEIQMDAPQNEQGDAGIQDQQQTPDYMELRPTQEQLTSSISEYQSLTEDRKNDAESEQPEYINADFYQSSEANKNKLYENFNT